MKTRFKFLALGSALVMTLAACGPKDNTANGAASGAASANSPTVEEKIQTLVTQSSRNQYKVTKTFDGQDGLRGVVVEPVNGGPKMVGWATSTGDHLLLGPLYNAKGENLSEVMLAEHAGYLKPEKLADEMMSRGFVAGKSGPVATIFFEPYCGYCNKLFTEIKPLIDRGELRVRFVMVGFLRPDSMARAADIEFDANPYKALTTWENMSDKTKAKDSKASDEQKSKIQRNSSLMNEAGQGGTPAILICNSETKKLELISGMPQDFSGFVKKVGSEGHDICNSK